MSAETVYRCLVQWWHHRYLLDPDDQLRATANSLAVHLDDIEVDQLLTLWADDHPDSVPTAADLFQLRADIAERAGRAVQRERADAARARMVADLPDWLAAKRAERLARTTPERTVTPAPRRTA